MGLPSPDSLSLSEAINFIVQRCGCSKRKAKEALCRAGQDGLLKASGDIPLSIYPNAKICDAHPVRRREALSAGDWGTDIDWTNGKVGRYFSVSIKRLSIEAWLNTAGETPSAPALPQAQEPRIINAIRAAYKEAKCANKKPPNVREIIGLVQERLRDQGYQASGHRIQTLASADEFKEQRRKPGPTVASEKSRD